MLNTTSKPIDGVAIKETTAHSPTHLVNFTHPTI